MSTNTNALGASLLALCLFSLPAAAETDLTVQIDNVRSATGKIHILVFADAKGFKNLDQDNAVNYAVLDAQKGHVSAHFSKMPVNCCAVFAFHDEDGNDDLKMSAGIPMEGYAFSHGKPDGQQPAFEKAIVKEETTKIELIYWY